MRKALQFFTTPTPLKLRSTFHKDKKSIGPRRIFRFRFALPLAASIHISHFRFLPKNGTRRRVRNPSPPPPLPPPGKTS